MRRYLIRIAALLVILAFVALGGSTLARLFSPPFSTVPFGGEASTDQFLGVLAVPHPAARLQETFQRWGNDKSFLFIAPANQPFWMQTYYTIAYLAYPRPVSAVACPANGVGREEIHKEVSRNIDVLIFFDMPPSSWSANAQPIGPILSVAPYQGSPVWKSFCR